MGKRERQRPAPYSTTDEQETLAIDTFRSLIDHSLVKLDIKERDKYPNTDGYVELVDEFRVPIAKLEVQIKKLPADERKVQCPLKLVSYSETTTCNPVLLVGVDTKQGTAYWVHVSADIIAKSPVGSTQRTRVVSFPKENVIDGKNEKYILAWKKIAESYQTRIREYTKLKNVFEELSKRSNPSLGIRRKDFHEIHIFLDRINMLLDRDFSVVKRIFYPTAWKVGLAYYRYEDDCVSYTLYPIPFNKNDVQIKQVDATLRGQLRKEGLGFRGHNFENPIKVRPNKYAIEIIESKTLRALKNRLMNHAGNEFLAREFIFALVDNFPQQLGLERKDKYAVDEIEKAFYQFLPTWVDESIRFLVKIQRNRIKSAYDLLYRRPYFDPDMLICQIMGDERKQIEQEVRERLKQKQDIPKIPIGNDRFLFGVFKEFLSFLKTNGVTEIDRAYVLKDFSRLQKGGLVYHLFSPEAIETNLKIFFDNLPVVYKNIVSRNFPRIVHKLPLFAGASRAIVFFKAKEKYEAFRDAPTIDFFYLKSEDHHGLKIELYKAEEKERFSNLSRDSWRKDIEIDGKKYNLVSWSTGILDFIYDNFPMFNFVYKILEENLKQYFSDLREQQ